MCYSIDYNTLDTINVNDAHVGNIMVNGSNSSNTTSNSSDTTNNAVIGNIIVHSGSNLITWLIVSGYIGVFSVCVNIFFIMLCGGDDTFVKLFRFIYNVFSVIWGWYGYYVFCINCYDSNNLSIFILMWFNLLGYIVYFFGNNIK
jgi:hypothetical protein